MVAGAEAIKDRTRQLYMDRFGVRILEGYGVTETAPVLAINTPLANKAGTVGRLSPLMEARLEPVPGIENGGRLYVRGPNVMLGYYRADNPGVLEPPVDGWHDTGDIVEIDPQGFITIKGRAKRFAKIGWRNDFAFRGRSAGGRALAAAHHGRRCAAGPRKGERLVLLTTDANCTREAFLQFARRKGATELIGSRRRSCRQQNSAARLRQAGLRRGARNGKAGVGAQGRVASGVAEERALDTAV